MKLTPGVNFNSISARHFLDQDEKLLLANGIQQTPNFTIHIGKISLTQNFGEIETQFFCQRLCDSDFLLGAQRLVKLTPGVNFFHMLTCSF